MDSQEATSLSGSSDVSSDNTENVIETNVSNSVTKINYNTSSTSSSNSLSSSSEYEDEGFASGDEEAFETAVEENPVFVEETLGNAIDRDDNGETFLEPIEFPMPKVELTTESDEIDDEVENVAGSSVLEGDSVVEAVPVDMPVPVRAVITNTEEEEDDDDDDVLLVGGDDDTNRIVEAPDVDSVVRNDMKLTAKGDSVVETVDVGLPLPRVAEMAVATKMEDDRDDVAMIDESESSEKMDDVLETVVDKEVVVDESKHIDEDAISASEVDVIDEQIESLNSKSSVTASSAISSDEVNFGIANQGDIEVIEDNGAKLTTLGEYVVEAGQVDMPAPEVALITTTEEGSDEDVLLVGGPDDTSDVVDIPPSATVDANGMKLTADVDSVVEAMDVDLPVPGVVGVTVVSKLEEDGDAVTVSNAAGSSEKDHVLEDVMYKKVISVAEGKISPLDVEASDGYDVGKNEKNIEEEIQKGVVYEAEEIGSVVNGDADFVVDASNDPADEAKHTVSGAVSASVEDNELENEQADKLPQNFDADEDEDMDSLASGEDTDGMKSESSEAAKQFMELEQGSGGGSHSGGESSQDRSQMIDGQIATDSDEEDGKELFGSSAMAALLRAASEGGSEGGNITFSSQDISRLFTVECPAGLGSSLQSMRPAPRFFNSSRLVSGGETDSHLSEEERVKLEKLQSIRVKFLRLVQRLGLSPDESVAAQVLYRLALIAGRQTGQSFSLEAAKRKAMELESGGRNDLDFSVNILVIGKSGVGKSATINSIFGEKKSVINAFQPATAAVKEIKGTLDGVKIRVFDTPGLKSSIMDQRFNRSIMSSVKKLTKKNPLDIVLYVDRLDAQTRDLNDLPLLRTITGSLGPSIWRNAIVTLTHSASAPPEGPSGSPLSYEVFVNQRSHVLQQCIGQAVGDLRMMSPSLMNPVSLVENHPSCLKNREGQKVLPNGQTWRAQLLMLCYSMKILSEANSLLKAQDSNRHGKLFGFRVRSPPLPYMLSSMLQSRAHPKLSDDGADSGVDLADLSDSDEEDEDEDYDQLPPFKPLKNSQLSKLSKEQRNAYFDEYDYRVKLLKKKQWKEELKRMREMKKKGKDYQSMEEEEDDGGAPAPMAVPLPDMVLPPSFGSDNPAYRFRFLEPTSQFLARPVLDTHGWDHDCGYDGVNIEQNLAIATRFPATVSAQITKDKKDFSFNLDSSVSTKHGENASSMAGFDIQPIGKQLAYIIRGETKFKNLKKNETSAGVSVTFLGENVVTGFKIEDQIAFAKQYSIVGSAGTVRFRNESAYGANIEVQRRELDYPIGQIQSTIGFSIIKLKGDLALGFNSLAQFSAGRNSKVAVRAGINNKMSGQITIKTSSSEHLSLAFAAIIPYAIAAYNKLWPNAGENYSTY